MVLQPFFNGHVYFGASESKRFTGGAFHRSAGSDRSIGLCARNDRERPALRGLLIR